MKTITTIGRDGNTRIGIGFVVVLALIAILQLAPWATRPRQVASMPTTSTNFSQVPSGYSDYLNLRTNPDRPNYSVAPFGMTDHPAPVAAARPNYSAAPAGMTDHPAPAEHNNLSAPPAGMTDHPAPAERVNHSEVPTGFSDYQSLQPTERVNYSEPPYGMTDHLSPAR